MLQPRVELSRSVQRRADQPRRLAEVLRVHGDDHHPAERARDGARGLLLWRLLRLRHVRRRRGNGGCGLGVAGGRLIELLLQPGEVPRGAAAAEAAAAAARSRRAAAAAAEAGLVVAPPERRQERVPREAKPPRLPRRGLLLLARLLALELRLLVALQRLQLLLGERVLQVRRLLRLRVRQLRDVVVHCAAAGKGNEERYMQHRQA